MKQTVHHVGGAVRDALLGQPSNDIDYVVVGSTPLAMLADGFTPVGKDFPVFLHPRTHAEYALARTERKVGQGYTGFAVHYAPDVTLVEDLARRDLTINAMARELLDDGSLGELTDPYGGLADLQNKILRHHGGAPARLDLHAGARRDLTGSDAAPEHAAAMLATGSGPG